MGVAGLAGLEQPWPGGGGFANFAKPQKTTGFNPVIVLGFSGRYQKISYMYRIFLREKSSKIEGENWIHHELR